MARRLVAVLFLDLVGWTRLAERVDPEPLQVLLEQYYEICSAAVQAHGGEIEKFIGDAIMAVFGAVSSQEDDALRALRAAFQIRAEVGELRGPAAATPFVEIHCGIAAGEALVTRSSHAGLRVVGDVVNLAARLQSAATAGEIVVNETVAHLAKRLFSMDSMAPLTLKGKAEPVPALLVTGLAVAAECAVDGPRMVDRHDERDRIREAYHRVVGDRRSHVVAVLGPPGIGKSRLVRETVAELGANAVFGSCPSYGHNGSYTALIQVLDALSEQANGDIDAVLTSLRDGSGSAVEEIAWAARETLAKAVASEPLVVVWESLEWAGESLLRLISELAEYLKDFPLLMICVARPELDVAWIRGGEVVDVGALTPVDSAQLAGLLAEVQPHELDLLDRITSYSAGNPLFLRLMLESSTPIDEVPATITAMVGAMIDRLPAPAREMLSAASVIGPTFTLEHLACLGEPVPDMAIGTLLDRQLVRMTARAGEYCFVQQPVHEVAYGRLDKERRLAWHRRLAEHDVSPAFHTEAAVRLLSDLRPHDEELPRLAQFAAEALLQEGTAALRQRDLPAAIGLLRRALNLVSAGQDRWRSVAAIRLSDALLLCGETQRAMEVVAEIPSLPCVVQRHLLAARLGAATEVMELDRDELDHLAKCRFEQLRMLLHLRAGRFGAAEKAACAALEHALAMGDMYEEERLLVAICEVRQWSPTPIAEKLAGCAELAGRFDSDRFLLVPILAARARCLALIGDNAGARTALGEASVAVEQLRLTMGRVLIHQASGLLYSLEGEHLEAERHFLGAAGILEQAGDVPTSLTMHVLASRQCPTRERVEELLPRSGQMDARGRILCLSAAAKLDADHLIPAVLDLLDATDDPILRGEIYFDLAQAHRRRGSHADAAAMAGAAIDSYASVGATLPMRLVQEWI